METENRMDRIKTNPLPVPGKDMDSIVASLEKGVEDFFTSEKYGEYLKTMTKFHRYSFNNTLLIAMQRPEATLVTGYRNWQSMGRQVRKGEKGITILAPTPKKEKKMQALYDQNKNPVLDELGNQKYEEVEVVVPRFKATTVFDIGQTDGKPVQTITPEELTAAVEDFELFMQAIEEISPVPIRFDEIEGSAKGYYDNANKEIVIRKGMSDSQIIKTAIHECGHAMLHDRELMKENGIQKDRETKEVEAESVAYCVCSAFQIETSDYSFPYIAGWSSGRDMKELRASMDTIRQTSGDMIDNLKENLQEKICEKKKDMLIAGMEAAGYFFDGIDNKENPLQFAPDGLHELSGVQLADSWVDVYQYLKNVSLEDSEQGERVGRVLYPEKYPKTSEELMFTGEQRYAIYQMDENAESAAYRFMGMEHLKNRGVEVSADDYNCVYSGRLLDSDNVDGLYATFNTRHPADYKTYSMSVSDVVIMNQNGQLQAYYVDSFGFEAIPDFVKQRQVSLGIISEPEMVDFSKIQEGISFYAAECSEFPVLGEVFQDLTLPEALEAYEKIPAERMNGIKCVGFDLKDGSDYEGMMDLVTGESVQREFLNSIPHYRDNPNVQKALDYVEKYMADRSRNVDKVAKNQMEGEKVEKQRIKPQKRREEMSL